MNKIQFLRSTARQNRPQSSFLSRPAVRTRSLRARRVSRGGVRLGRAVAGEEPEQVPHRDFARQGAAQGQILLHPVRIAPPHPLLPEVPGGFQLGDDAPDGALGQLQRLGNLFRGDPAVLGDEGEHGPVIGNERPLCHEASQFLLDSVCTDYLQ